MKLVAIDGNSLINRAFYGVRELTNSKGFPTNAIYGFYNVLNKVLTEVEPNFVMVAFDLKAKTFRHKQFDLYKANRKPMPNELFLQLVEVKKMLKMLGICVCEKEGFEADDLLGSISKICRKQQVDCIIVSGDRDVLQLVDEHVNVRLLTNKGDVVFDEAKVLSEFGVAPAQLIEVKALMGDSSDNIPGVRGIGEKTAFKLIWEFKNVDNIFKNVENLNVTTRVKNLLKADDAKKMCYLSKELGTICVDAGLNENLNFYLKKEVDWKNLKFFLEEFELKKILNSFSENFAVDENELKGSFNLKSCPVVTDENFKIVQAELQHEEFLNFLFYDDCLFLFTKNKVYKFSKLKEEAFENLVVSSLKPKRTTNLKEIYKTCLVRGLKLKNVVFSCDIASYLIDVLEKNHDVVTLSKKFFDSENVVDCFLPLCLKLEENLQTNNLNFLLNEVELPLCRVLAEMEFYGFMIDKLKLEEFGSILNEKIDEITNQIWAFCGEKFNLNSSKELGVILFERLGLPKTKKIKTGFSTDVESLSKLVKYSEVVPKILIYRNLSKLLSTYVHGLQKVIQSDGRVHSSFHQTQTRTGRISSTNPNIQNIPIKTELGSEMRKFFVAGEGNVLVDCDYSQIELRILAAMSGDEKMINAFKNNQDIHKLTAMHLFGVMESEVSDEFRRRAKTINFSVIYGITAFSLAKDIGVSIKEAQNYIDSFFEGFSTVKQYFDKVIEEAKKTGEVKTMFGRIRKVPELNSKSKKIVALGERIAKNTPIQGSCADLIKMAMIKVSNRLKMEGLSAKLILQVHDELLIEVKEEFADFASKILKEEMESVTKFSVPLVANVSVGKTWFDC